MGYVLPAALTPSSPRHRLPLCLRPVRPHRLLLRLALLERKHRQLPTDQKGLSRDMLNEFCSCTMVTLNP